MTPKELNAVLAREAENVCRMLLPNGKRIGSEWECGSVSGEAGKSCKVHLIGDKAGVWADFATDESGDLLDLWQAAKNCTLLEAMDQARSYLGLPDFAFKPAKKQHTRPERPKCKRPEPNNPVYEYLAERGIKPETMQAYRIGTDRRWIVLPYIRNGELLNIKHLGIDRDEKGHHPSFTSKDPEPCLFGWQTIPDKARSIAITEGEIDAMTLHQFGIHALSVPYGGGGGDKQRWVEYDYPYLERFDQIFLCLDNDDTGKQALIELVDRLGRHRCRAVTFGEYKDANDALQAGWKLEDFAKSLMSSKTIDPEELKNAAEFVDDVIERFYPPENKPLGTRLPWDKVGDNLLFRECEMTIWTGINGHGKSLIIGHAMVSAVAQGRRVCIASMEMPAAATLERMIRQTTGLSQPSTEYIRSALNWLGGDEISGGLWLFAITGSAKADRLIDVMVYARRRYQVTEFVVDSLAKCGFAEDDYNGQKGFVDRLSDFARDNRCHVHLVAHSRKGRDESQPPGKLDVKGTGAITDMVDNVLTAWRNKVKEEAIAAAESEGEEIDEEILGKPDAALIVHKQRYSGWEKPIYLWFDSGSMQYHGSKNQPNFQYVKYSTASSI